jgi:catechol 2,3-dioxygenase-like lactoylglutathione lyase family enzyme
MPIAWLNHVSVCARNLSDSMRFYQEVFGAEPVPTPNFGFPVQWLRVGDLQLHLFERPEGAPRYAHLAFAVEDLDRVYRLAKERGWTDGETFAYHLNELPGGQVQLYLRDPAGNLVEVNHPDASALGPEARADLRRLADRLPQSEENQRARLFLSPRRAAVEA